MAFVIFPNQLCKTVYDSITVVKRQIGSRYGFLMVRAESFEERFWEQCALRSISLLSLKKSLNQTGSFNLRFRKQYLPLSYADRSSQIFHNDNALVYLHQRDFEVCFEGKKINIRNILPTDIFNCYRYNNGFHAIGVFQNHYYHFFHNQGYLHGIRVDLRNGFRIEKKIGLPFDKARLYSFFDIQNDKTVSADLLFRYNHCFIVYQNRALAIPLQTLDRLISISEWNPKLSDYHIISVQGHYFTCSSYSSYGINIIANQDYYNPFIIVSKGVFTHPKEYQTHIEHLLNINPFLLQKNIQLGKYNSFSLKEQ